MQRHRKDFLKRAALTVHRIFAKLGLHILPKHYYTPFADLDQLAQSKKIWAKPSEMPGMAISLAAQAKEFAHFCAPFAAEVVDNQNYKFGVQEHFGPGFGYIEAKVLHTMIRSLKPAKVIEIGSGVSTWCSLQALQKNQFENQKSFELICVEPYPSAKLQSLAQIKLERRFVQTCPHSLFEQLQAGDILFIDSSHTVKPGADVNFLFLEVIPRLRPGVIIHVHDIYFPYDYQRDVLQTFFQASETALLRALLIGNEHLKILFSLSHLHYVSPQTIANVFADYKRQPDEDGLHLASRAAFAQSDDHFPSSIWLQTL
jgi:predicted O-methyltransferase YrrM